MLSWASWCKVERKGCEGLYNETMILGITMFWFGYCSNRIWTNSNRYDEIGHLHETSWDRIRRQSTWAYRPCSAVSFMSNILCTEYNMMIYDAATTFQSRSISACRRLWCHRASPDKVTRQSGNCSGLSGLQGMPRVAYAIQIRHLGRNVLECNPYGRQGCTKHGKHNYGTLFCYFLSINFWHVFNLLQWDHMTTINNSNHSSNFQWCATTPKLRRVSNRISMEVPNGEGLSTRVYAGRRDRCLSDWGSIQRRTFELESGRAGRKTKLITVSRSTWSDLIILNINVDYQYLSIHLLIQNLRRPWQQNLNSINTGQVISSLLASYFNRSEMPENWNNTHWIWL